MSKKITKTEPTANVDADFDGVKPAAHKVVARYNYFKGLLLCFYSRAFYVDVIERWKGYGMLYLLLVSAVVMVPFSLYKMNSLQDYYANTVWPSINQFPAVAIHDGKASLDKPMPFMIKDKQSGKPVIIIDTTDKINDLKDKKYREVFLLINQHEQHFKLASLTALVTKYPTTQSGELNQQGLKAAVDKIKEAVFITMYPSLVLSVFFSELIVLIFVSMLAGFFARVVLKTVLTFKQSLRLCCVVATSNLVIATATLVLGWQQQTAGLVMFGAFFLYYCFAVVAYRNRQKGLTTT